MYSSNKKTTIDSTITVTPIKVEMSSISQSYPTPSSSGCSVALAATTTRSPRRQSQPPPTPETTQLNHPNAVAITNPNTGTTPKEKLTKTPRVLPPRKPPPTIDTFWPTIMTEVRGIQQVDAKHQALPLARIKKIMKLDENAKMIAAEAPLLFAKACEYFIQELTMRAWIHTEESKRRTLQRSDIAQAIANYDQFDFLIDIVPREDIKPAAGSHKKESQTTSTTGSGSGPPTGAGTTSSASSAMGGGGLKMEQQELPHQEMISFATLPTETLASSQHLHHQQQQHHQPTLVPQQQLQIIQQQTAHPQQMQYYITTTPDALAHNQQQQAAPQQHLQIIQQTPHPQYFITTHTQPQQLILTTGPNGQLTATPAATAATAQQQQTALLQNLAHQQQQQQQIQLLQQVVTPTGELTNVPITISANQLNLLRLQMQTTPQQLLQLSAAAPASNTAVTSAATHNIATSQSVQHHQQQHTHGGATNIYLNAATSQPAQIPPQSNTSIVSTDRNLGSTFRQNC